MEFKEKKTFYKWAKKLGINLIDLDIATLDNSIEKNSSSFKNRAAEIKKIHNYSFKNDSQNIFNFYPNIENIDFIKI